MPVDQYTGGEVKLPHPNEIPNVDLQVVNFHRPAFGTFHSKFMVVDRKIGLFSSNNIQDNDNVEMMTQVEGPIVDSLYDTALASWCEKLDPPLNTYSDASAPNPTPTFDSPIWSKIFDEQGQLRDLTQVGPDLATTAAEAPVQTVPQVVLPKLTPSEPRSGYDGDLEGEIRRMQSVLAPKEGESTVAPVTRHLNEGTHLDISGSAPEIPADNMMRPYIPIPRHDPVPMAMVSRKPYGGRCPHRS